MVWSCNYFTSSIVNPIQLSCAEGTLVVAWVVTSETDSKLASELLRQSEYIEGKKYIVSTVSFQLQVGVV